MTPKPPAAKKLGELELLVLEHLWEAGRGNVQEVHGAIGVARGTTANTVGSALERLYRKGLVCRDKVSHAYCYRCALSREEFTAQQILQLCGDAQALSRSGVLAAFVDLVAEHDGESLAKLEKLVEAKRAEEEE